jgi:hypothetical protein
MIVIRTSIARLARRAAPSRNFVSSVLLTRDWQTETVASLKEQLRDRGLSTYVSYPHSSPLLIFCKRTGNKSTLITRIQEYDKEKVMKEVTPREMSTTAAPTEPAPPKTPPASPQTTPVTPPTVAPRDTHVTSQDTPTAPQTAPVTAHSFPNIIIPEIPEPQPEPVQVVRAIFLHFCLC